MRKERIFVGSSSEGEVYVKQMMTLLTKVADDYVFTSWRDFFVPVRTTYDQIINNAPIYDFAIFICTPDDKCYRKRDMKENKPPEAFETTRDNVYYEAGYFSGVISSKRVFLLIQDGCVLASDHSGLNTINFNDSNFATKCFELLQHIKDESQTTRIGTLPSTSLAVSFCNSFLRNIIQGINKEDKSLRAYFKGCRSGKKFEKIQVNIILPQTLSIELNAWIDYHTQHLELTEKNLRNTKYKVLIPKKSPIENGILQIYDVPRILNSLEKIIQLATGIDHMSNRTYYQYAVEKEIDNYRKTVLRIAQNEYPDLIVKFID